MAAEAHLTHLDALRIYFRERFPLPSNGMLIAVLTASAVCYAAASNPPADLPTITRWLAGFVTVLLVFLLMRFLDEFKDAKDDATHRPYRPVPRGLISLKSIGALAVCAVAAQLAVQWIWLPDQFLLLGAVYGYLALMTVEFGAGRWLKRHPLTYAVSHMFIMPLIGLYAAGIAPSDAEAPIGLFGYLVMLFFAGFVIEIGRKIRAPGDEEPGVDTYSALYGPIPAACLWLVCVYGSFCAALWLLRDLPFAWLLAGALSAGLAACAIVVYRYAQCPETGSAKPIELASGLWSLLLLAGIAIAGAVQVMRVTP